MSEFGSFAEAREAFGIEPAPAPGYIKPPKTSRRLKSASKTFRKSYKRITTKGAAKGTVKYRSGDAWAAACMDDINMTKAAATRIFRSALIMLVDHMQAEVPYDTGFLHSSMRIAVGRGPIYSTLSSIYPLIEDRDERRESGILTPASPETGTFRRRLTGGRSRKLDYRRTGMGRVPHEDGSVDAAGRQAHLDPIHKANFGDRVIIQYLAHYASLVHDGSSEQEAQPWMANALRRAPFFFREAARAEGLR